MLLRRDQDGWYQPIVGSALTVQLMLVLVVAVTASDDQVEDEPFQVRRSGEAVPVLP
jgi:hypothetical protein